MTNLPESLSFFIDQLIKIAKTDSIKNISISDAWKILQLATADVITFIERNNVINLDGKSKKELALLYMEKFYDAVFVIIDIPFVPSFLEPIIHRYVKKLLMTLVGSSIDALVVTFKRTGFFQSKEILDRNLEPKPKVSDK
jgi:hypothetical protein